MKYENNRYDVVIETGQEVTITIQQLKAWGHLTYIVSPSRIAVKRDKFRKDVFHLLHRNNEKFIGSMKVVYDPSDNKAPYRFVEYNQERELQEILDATLEAQEAMEAGMSEHLAIKCYLYPLKEVAI